MRDDFLIRAAIEWARVSNRLRDAEDCPLRAAALRVPREAALCHLLVAAGRPEAVMACLGKVMRDARCNADLPVAGDVVVDAASVLGHLRLAVNCRFPV